MAISAVHTWIGKALALVPTKVLIFSSTYQRSLSSAAMVVAPGDPDVVALTVSDHDHAGQVTIVIEQAVQLDGALGAAGLGPIEHRGTQVDHRGVQADRQFEARA